MIIPLGVIAELALGPVRGLGLIARTQLLTTETELIGRMLRDKLSNPFDFLKEDFDRAWARIKEGNALSTLVGQNTDSLFYAPSRLKGFTAEESIDAASARLRSMLNKEYKAFLDEAVGKRVSRKVEPRKGDAFLVAAA